MLYPQIHSMALQPIYLQPETYRIAFVIAAVHNHRYTANLIGPARVARPIS